MRIGILTLPLISNYGGILQAYAMQTVLRRMGHEVKVIDVDCKARVKWYKAPIAFPYRMVRKMFGSSAPVFFERQLNVRKKEKERYTRQFIDRHIDLFKVRKLECIRKDDFDAIIVGSDQIWRPCYVGWFVGPDGADKVFLSFTDGWHIRRIAYAASFGTDDWRFPQELTPRCAHYASLFDAISVREASGVELCRQYLHVKATHVLDPTMLLDAEDYLALLQAEDLQASHPLVTYVLDKNERSEGIVKAVSAQLGYQPHELNMTGISSRGVKVQQPLEQWLAGIANCECVITDSFHACVFSIIFNKPFIVIVNEDRGASRFHSLLDMFAQSHRIVESPNHLNISGRLLDKPDCNMDALRRVSTDFLRQAGL